VNSTDGTKVLARSRKDQMVNLISKTRHGSPG
jgi:hypothetical protein